VELDLRGCKFYSFLLLGLLCGLGGGTGNVLLLHLLDDTDGDGLPHVTDSEATQGREVREGFHAHGLGGDELNNSSISRLDGLGVGLGGLTSTTINLLLDLVELASDVSGVAIQDWSVTVGEGPEPSGLDKKKNKIFTKEDDDSWANIE